MDGFGQMIDRTIWNYPVYGMYNIHPSNLALKEGKGVDPFQEVIAQKRDNITTTVHHVDDSIDGGHIVGFYSGTYIRKATPPYDRMSITEISQPLAQSASKIFQVLIAALIKLQGSPRQTIQAIDFDNIIPGFQHANTHRQDKEHNKATQI